MTTFTDCPHVPRMVEKTLEQTHLLVAAGCTPNNDGIGLELAGVEVNDRGFLKVNELLRTTAENVWAIREVAGSGRSAGALGVKSEQLLTQGEVFNDEILSGTKCSSSPSDEVAEPSNPATSRTGTSPPEYRQVIDNTCVRSSDELQDKMAEALNRGAINQRLAGAVIPYRALASFKGDDALMHNKSSVMGVR